MPDPDNTSKPRATRIVWEREVIGPDVQDRFGSRSLRYPPTIRRSPTYLELGRYFLKRPPIGDEGKFRPRDLPGRTASALLTYRQDVESWVAMEMCSAVSQDEQFKDRALFRQTLRKLLHKAWDTDVAERGFYLVQPIPGSIEQKVTTKDADWQLQAIGIRCMPQIKAYKIGWWRQPEPEEWDLCQTRLVLTQFRSYITNATEVALKGGTIGQLDRDRLFTLVEDAAISARKMLPPAKEEKEDEKDE